MKKSWLRIALPALGFLSLIAPLVYSWSRGPVYGEIEGRVTRGGAPLDYVQVVFYPEEDGLRSTAITDEKGYFEAMTDAIQNVPARKGAPVGKYRVALVDRRDAFLARMAMARARAAAEKTQEEVPDPIPLAPEQQKNASGSGTRVPPQYNLRLDTPFRDIEIKPGKNWFDLDVK